MNEVVFKKRFNVKKDLFANNEQGLWLDPSDMTREKAAWRRNLLGYSEQFDNAAWAKQGLGAGGIAPTVTANSAVAPDGTNTADTISFGIKAGTATNRIIQTTSVAIASRTFTGSIWLKIASGTANISIYVDDSVTGGPYGSAALETVTLTTSWQRFDVSVPFTPTETGFVRLSLVQDSAATTTAFDLYAWGAQLELGSTPTDYQPITDFSTEFKAAFPTHTLYQDSNGVTPCTAAGDPVGLILDQSRGGLGAMGSELVTNGGFDADTNWTKGTGWTITGGLAVATSAAAFSALSQNLSFGASKFIKIRVTATINSGTVYVQPSSGSAPATIRFLSAGVNDFILITGASGSNFQFIAGGGGFDGTIDNISVREVPGNHAYQTTSASRPTLARIPSSGRRNLLTRTEELSNAAWGAFNVSNSTVLNGTVSLTTSEGFGYIRQTGSFSNAVDHTISFDASCDQTVANVPIRIGGDTSVSSLVSFTAGITQRVTLTGYRPFGGGTPNIQIGLDARDGVVPGGSNSTGYTVTFNRVQLETGSTATSYQKVVATTDVTESGVSDLWHLVFDGSDDSLVTNAVDFNTWTQETRRNLLVDTEDFSTWTNNGGTVSSNTTEAPDGTMTADTLVRASGVNDGRFRSVTFTGDGAKAVSVYVKAGTAPTLSVWLYDSTAVANRVLADVNMTVSPPTVTLTAGASSSVEDVGNGWFRLKFVSTSVTAANTHSLYLLCARSPSIDGQTSIFWGAQAENSATVTTYQRVGTDEMTVIAGVRQAVTPSAENVIVELSTFYNSNSGTLIVNSNTSPNFGFAARGTSTGFYTPTATLPSTNVLSCNFDISGAALAQQIIPRINGQLSQSGAFGSLGSGNFGNYQLFIGRRNQATLPFNGHIYQLIIRGKTTPTGKLLEAERFVGKKTGVNL